MKILILDIYYSEFLKQFYQKNEAAQHLPYSTQRQALFDLFFGTSDFYSTNLKKLGHDAEEIIVNNEILQKQWAHEHGISYKKGYFQTVPKLRNYFKSDWEEKILEEQIKQYDPDVLYCQSLTAPNPQFMRRVKKYAKLVVGQVACPTDFDREKLSHFDLIVTSFPHFVERFKALGIPSEYFKIGFEPRVLEKLKKEPRSHDAVFVGGISKHHTAIIETFEYLAHTVPIDFWGYGAAKLPPDSPIRARHHGEAWGIDMFNVLHNAKISVNRHIDAAENNANNMRLYESTGVGSMLITDEKDNINELFDVGKEIETYRTKEELADKIRYYLEHDSERQAIAAAGQARTLRDHTYEVRMKELVTILERHLP